FPYLRAIAKLEDLILPNSLFISPNQQQFEQISTFTATLFSSHRIDPLHRMGRLQPKPGDWRQSPTFKFWASFTHPNPKTCLLDLLRWSR
ncbi:hypothetical protein, partial [Paenibacillus marchantiophytorum]|uniref:hypothetical protein n=1 Tax=Paenibacillus marchantiophytorum TaxID=1619310 RepID=UPI001E3CA34B